MAGLAADLSGAELLLQGSADADFDFAE